MNEELEKFLADLRAEAEYEQLEGENLEAHLDITRSLVRTALDELKNSNRVPVDYEDNYNAAILAQYGPDQQFLRESSNLVAQVADLVEETTTHERLGQPGEVTSTEKLKLAHRLLKNTPEEVDHSPALVLLDTLFPADFEVAELSRDQIREQLYEARPDIALEERHEDIGYSIKKGARIISAKIIQQVTNREVHDKHPQNIANLTQFILLRVNSLIAPYLDKDLNPAAVADYIRTSNQISNDFYHNLDLSDEEKLQTSLFSESRIQDVAKEVLRQRGIEVPEIEEHDRDIDG